MGGEGLLLNELLGRVSPTSTADKKQNKSAISAITTTTAMAIHATAIRWRFFKNPPRKSAMAPPFNNTDIKNVFFD